MSLYYLTLTGQFNCWHTFGSLGCWSLLGWELLVHQQTIATLEFHIVREASLEPGVSNVNLMLIVKDQAGHSENTGSGVSILSSTIICIVVL
ncbi:hypothetical protein NTGM5_60015 [Candidatus Nitrotoga sp. M5]|nr:hypothetical protein NTGM5_60015 [Candidatus Nitrotoga sp. M5]